MLFSNRYRKVWRDERRRQRMVQGEKTYNDEMMNEETLRVSQTEGKVARLPCGGKTTGSVTWSRDTNGQREEILTTTNGETTKHVSDPDRHYNTQSDLTLTIRRVSQSDAGRYYCGGATVELTVTDKTLRVSQTEGKMARLPCGGKTTGSVTWSRDTNGQREDILTTTNGKTTKHISDPDRRYSTGANLVLYIRRVSQSDAGRYYCGGATVELTVTDTSNQKRMKDPVYHLATFPGVQTTVHILTNMDSNFQCRSTSYYHTANGLVDYTAKKTLRVSQTEGKMARLPCGGKTTGSVTWSRDTNGQREDILTTTNGKTTKLISDPDRRYDTQADLTLTIRRVSQSDAGRYYCGGATVELTVTDHVVRVSQTESTQAVLHCGTQTTGTVTWSRDNNGQREDILTTTNGEVMYSADSRYTTGRSLALVIYGVSRSDAGTYYCHRTTVELTVIPGAGPPTAVKDVPAGPSGSVDVAAGPPAPDDVGAVPETPVLPLVPETPVLPVVPETPVLPASVCPHLTPAATNSAVEGSSVPAVAQEMAVVAAAAQGMAAAQGTAVASPVAQDTATGLPDTSLIWSLHPFNPRLVSITRCLSAMERVGFLCLLLCGHIHMISSETLRVSQTEGKVAKLPCGGKTTGSVTWSRDTNGQREDILTTTNGKTTKHVSDPDRRYGSGADLTLTIRRVSQSDAGRYYCGGATVELTVTDHAVRVTEGTQAVLHCGTQTTGTVTWSRDTNRQRVDILNITNGEVVYSADSRYSSARSLTLIIYQVSRSDAGTYYCNRATVELTVIPGTGLWKFLVIAAVSCLVVVVLLVLISWRCFFNRKEDGEMLYDDVYTYTEYVNVTKEQAGSYCKALRSVQYGAVYSGWRCVQWREKCTVEEVCKVGELYNGGRSIQWRKKCIVGEE
ncbi:hypothetical protein NFI96_000062 [Prochilodus magdalenae]|nr:hypothetical protein NFI96_000062 [Prochilodus magdalenae]